MVEPYLIKKYSSRRLYDVAAGQFLNIADVDQLICQGRRIKVVDSKGKDATRGVLLQILVEREDGREPLLSEDILHEIIRLYGQSMQGPFGRFLEEGLALMRKQREAWQSMVPEVLREGTNQFLNTLTGQGPGWWQAMRDAWLPPAPPVSPERPQPKKSRPARK